MYKKIIIALCLLAGMANAQKNRVGVDSAWAGRFVPVSAQRVQTWLSFYNTVDNPSIGTGSIVMSSRLPLITFSTVLANGALVNGATIEWFNNGTYSGIFQAQPPFGQIIETVTEVSTGNETGIQRSPGSWVLSTNIGTVGASYNQTGGTITLTGITTLTGTSASLRSLNNNALKLRVGSATAPTATLDVTGTSAFSSSMTLSGPLILSDGLSVVTGTSTGALFGATSTQKMGWWGATPVIRPLATTDLATLLSDIGLRASGNNYPITTTNTITAATFISSDGMTLVRSGSVSQVGAATTAFTVTIGTTQANSTYKVNVTPTNLLAAAAFYVSSKTTTQFVVTYIAGLTGTVSFDYILAP